MHTNYHLINSRPYTTFHNNEANIDDQKNYLFDLSYLGVVDLIGEKALEFLQGQLTCDLKLMSKEKMIQGIQCNLKGRIMSLLDIINWQGIQLILPNDLIESTIVSLGKAALLSRVSIQKSEQLKVFGFYLQNANDLLPTNQPLPNDPFAQITEKNYCVYHLGKGYYVFILVSENGEQFSKPFIEKNQLLGSLTWHTFRLYEKQIEIYPESRQMFLPHRLGLHETHYISFNKGCYKGQEIIARLQYRGTLKHKLTTFPLETKKIPFSGQKLFQENREVGEIIDYSWLDDHHYFLAASVLSEFDSSSCSSLQ